MLYDRGNSTGRDLTVKDFFEKVEGALVDADMLHRDHHMYLGGRRRMLKSTNGSKVLAVWSAAVLS